MGATSFFNTGSGPDAKSAFDQEVAIAKMASGEDREPHDDEDILAEDEWCSNIGDKTDFVMLETPAGLDTSDPRAVEEACMVLLEDPRCSGTFGPAGCIDLGPSPRGAFGQHHNYAFFGWSPE